MIIEQILVITQWGMAIFGIPAVIYIFFGEDIARLFRGRL